MPLGRRSFVRSLGLSALLAPFAGGLLDHAVTPNAVRADTRRVAKRVLFVFSPNGTVVRHWRPSGTGESLVFAPGSILEPLARHAADLIVLDGLDFPRTANHEPGMAAMLTGNGTASSPGRGMSIDQWIARRLAAPTRFASLELGVQTSAWGGNAQTRMCYSAPDAYVPPDDDPASVFRRVFAGVAQAPAQLDAVLEGRRSSLDLVRAELAALRARAGVEQRALIDAHVDSLRRLEVGLSTPQAGATCAIPSVAQLDPYDNDRFPELVRAQMDLAVAALACDATRVCSLQLAHTVTPLVPTWLNLGEGHHALSHIDDANAAGVQRFVAAERWFSAQLAYLLDRLAGLPDPSGDGRMLDHTLVVWAKELGDARLHECTNVPFVLAGSAGGRLRTGRHVRLDHAPHQQLLVSIAQAMGLDDVAFGDPATPTGPLAVLAT